nr:MAG TPA: hypothetical protein [Caudoviricetes sp.]
MISVKNFKIKDDCKSLNDTSSLSKKIKSTTDSCMDHNPFET